MSSSSGTVSRVTRTPARSSRSVAAAKAAATVSSKFSSGKPCAMPKRTPASGVASSGANSSPAITASALAQSATLFASGPMESSVVLKGKAPVSRHALAARLEADDAAQRRRDAHRASGVAADGYLGHAVADRDRGAGRRAAGHTRAIARIARRAEMRIGADGTERELGHVGLGDDHGASRSQSAHDGSVDRGGRSLVGEDFRARPRRLAGDVEQILDADDRSVERAERYAVFGARIRRVRRRARGAGIDRQARPPALPVRIGDADERLFKPVAGGGRLHVNVQIVVSTAGRRRAR